MREQLEAQVEALAAQMRALDDENARLRVRHFPPIRVRESRGNFRVLRFWGSPLRRASSWASCTPCSGPSSVLAYCALLASACSCMLLHAVAARMLEVITEALCRH